MKYGQSGMHVTMLRLSFAYVIFTAPLLPAHLVDNTSHNNPWMTPFKVRFVNTFFDTMYHSESLMCVMFFFSVNDALLVVLLDVRNQRHHLRCLFKWIPKSVSHFLWRCRCWSCNSVDKQLFSKKTWYINSCDWTIFLLIEKEQSRRWTIIFINCFQIEIQCKTTEGIITIANAIQVSWDLVLGSISVIVYNPFKSWRESKWLILNEVCQNLWPYLVPTKLGISW